MAIDGGNWLHWTADGEKAEKRQILKCGSCSETRYFPKVRNCDKGFGGKLQFSRSANDSWYNSSWLRAGYDMTVMKTTPPGSFSFVVYGSKVYDLQSM